jgi:multidrug efflux system membrane fusion protein
MPSQHESGNTPERKPIAGQGGSVSPAPKGFPWKTIVFIMLALAAIALLVVWRRGQAGSEAKGPGRGGMTNAVPVVIGTVEEKDVPVFLDGLGTVQAFNTVTVRSRVDGQLQKVAFREGQDVRAGDLLAQLDAAPFESQVEQAEAKKAQDEAQLANAALELRRDEELLKNKILAQDVYDTQKALVNQLEAAVKADEAAINSARVQLNYTRIIAPIEGRTGLRLVDEGNIIQSGQSSNGIVVLTQLKPISVVFTLPEQTLRDIQSHSAEGELTVLAVDRDNKTVLNEGKLAVVDNEIDTSTGTIRLKATMPNEQLKLWPGQFVNARLLLEVRKHATVVPATVVQRGPEGPYAFVVESDMTVKMQTVKVAMVEQELAVVESGLSSGQKVVVDGQFKLQPGSKVKPVGEGPPAGDRTTTNPQKKGEGRGKT